MQKKNYSKLSAILLLCLTNCATGFVDDPVCKEITPERGTCVRIISGKQFEVNETNKLDGKTWWEMRPYFIAVPPDTWANMKKAIIDTCKKGNSCDERIPSWDRTLDSVDGMMGNK